MKASSGPLSPGEARPRRPGRFVWGLGAILLAAGALTLGWLVAQRPPPRPIPVPAGLAQFDPQVREHLTRLARRVAEAPRDPSRRAELGLAFAANSLWPEARTCFQDATALGDPSPLPPTYAAAALVEAGQSAAAAAELQAVVARHPDFAPAWQRLAMVLVQVGRFSEASNGFAQVTRLAPAEWRGWTGLGEVALRSGQPTQAIEPLERARALDPSARPVRHLLSLAYRAAGRVADAAREAAAGQSQSIGPMEDPWSERAQDHMMSVSDQLARADLLLSQGHAEAAIERLQTTLRHHPTNLLVITRAAAAFNAADQAATSWRLLAPFLDRFTNDASLLISATHTASALGQTNHALELARRALALAPRFAEAHVAHADALVAAQRDTEAADSLRQALEFAPGNVHLLLQLGDLLRHNLGLADQALAAYRRARDADPLHPGPLDRLASLQIERRDFLEADHAISGLRQLRADPRLVAGLEHDLAEARAKP